VFISLKILYTASQENICLVSVTYNTVSDDWKLVSLN